MQGGNIEAHVFGDEDLEGKNPQGPCALCLKKGCHAVRDGRVYSGIRCNYFDPFGKIELQTQVGIV